MWKKNILNFIFENSRMTTWPHFTIFHLSSIFMRETRKYFQEKNGVMTGLLPMAHKLWLMWFRKSINKFCPKFKFESIQTTLYFINYFSLVILASLVYFFCVWQIGLFQLFVNIISQWVIFWFFSPHDSLEKIQSYHCNHVERGYQSEVDKSCVGICGKFILGGVDQLWLRGLQSEHWFIPFITLWTHSYSSQTSKTISTYR